MTASPKAPGPGPQPASKAPATAKAAPAAAAAPPSVAPTVPPLGGEKTSKLFWDLLRKRPDPLTSVAFTVPVFLLYHLGILLVDRRSQVDFVSTLVLRVLETSVPAYVLMTLALALVLLLVAWVKQKRTITPPHPFLRVLGEGIAFAMFCLMALGWATHEVRADSSSQLSLLSVVDKIVLAAGTGFHEEFIFRVLLVTGGAWLITKLGRVRPRFSLLIAMLVSSVLFSLAHYFVIFDEPFVLTVAGYRVLEGLLFATIYVSRGFAIAVYAHAIYDLMAYFVYA